MQRVIASWLFLFIFWPGSEAVGLVVNFTNGDAFDGDTDGDVGGSFVDGATGITGTVTTLALSPGGSVLNSTSDRLGINSGSGSSSSSSSSFDPGESWTFSWDVNTEFTGIDFADFSTGTERFFLSSTAWAALSITPTDGNIDFSTAGGLGVFRFESGDTSDDFNLTDLSNDVPLPVPSGTGIELAFSSTASDTARLTSMTFSAIPEPTAFALTGGLFIVIAGAALIRRLRHP